MTLSDLERAQLFRRILADMIVYRLTTSDQIRLTRLEE